MLWCALYLPALDQPERLALWALQFTPRLCVQPQGVLLEVEGSLRLFGGLRPLLGKLRAGLAQQGERVCVATAPTAHGAWLLAQARDGAQVSSLRALREQLAQVPITRLETAAAHTEALHGLGLRTIGQLLALPRAALARRFGAGLIDELDRALGQAADARPSFVPPESFALKLELMTPVHNADALNFAARRLLSALCGWLAARQAATGELLFNLWHEAQAASAPTRVPLRLASACRDEARLCALLREVLAQTRLPAPVVALALRCDAWEPAGACAAALPWSPHAQAASEPAAHSWASLLERLQARLGAGGVQRLGLQSDHRPEHAFALCAPDAPLPDAGAAPAAKRPLWLLAQPKPMDVAGLVWVSGPERIESGWWEGRWCARDYVLMRDARQALLWVFRPRPPDAQCTQAAAWFLHGWFG